MTFRLPPYPYDRLSGLAKVAEAHEGGMVDCSIGTPYDPPPAAFIDALASSGTERGYPASAGSPQLREAAAGWLARRFALPDVPPSSVAACVGTKELVASVPHLLRLRDPGRDTVLFPAVSYPTYAMGAELAGCRAVPVPAARARLGGLQLDAIDAEDAGRALLLWSNSPSNPTGGLGDLGAEAAWGRAHGVPLFSDECYAEFTWDGPPRSVLQHGPDGVVAVHSLSKRSNLAGVRVGFYAGDGELVEFLRAVRQHAGLMVPGPAQAAAVAALADDDHVEVQRGTLPGAPGLPGRRPRRVRLPGGPAARAVSTSGCRCPAAAGPTPGPWRRRWPPTVGSWSARATSTARTVRDTCGWPSSSRWSGWLWWASASPACPEPHGRRRRGRRSTAGSDGSDGGLVLVAAAGGEGERDRPALVWPQVKLTDGARAACTSARDFVTMATWSSWAARWRAVTASEHSVQLHSGTPALRSRCTNSAAPVPNRLNATR